MSTELAEIRHALARIETAVATTANDVGWIKSGMTDLSERLDNHVETDGKRFSKIENRQHWLTGVYSAISAGLAVWGDRFFGGHT